MQELKKLAMRLCEEAGEVPGTFAALYGSLDPRPEERGKQFERVVRWFLMHDPAWATQVDEVWLWNDWPERWGADCGIDLIFRHKNGEMWAVQAKCYSPDHTVTKHDVDRFLSESNRSLIQRRLLVATTDRIGTNALRVCEAQEKPVVLLRLSDFNSSLLDYPSEFEHLHQSLRRPRPVPRDHQNEAIAAVSNGLRGADRGQLIMACGTGKTYVTLWVKEALNAQRTLVLVPSLGLLSQLLREWTHAASVPFELLCVCSDESVGSKAGDDAVHSVMDLAFRVTSDAAEVRAFLCGAGNRVVISTYQSSLVVAAAQAEPSVPAFDLAIADEAHRCAGKVGGDFSAILNNEKIRSAKRLFATATPRIYSRGVKSAAEARGVEVVGMDDSSSFGAVLYALPFGKAIERKLLTDYRVVIIGVDDATIAQWIDQRKLVSTGTGVETDSESLAAQIGLLKAMKDYDLKRVISFHSRVSRAEGFITELQKVSDWISDDHRPSGDLHADFVSGNMPAGKRRLKLDRLKEVRANERAVLSNARCLAEGVDVPSLDGVAFIDPRSSHVDIVQAVGRAIRLSPEKKTGTIILPVFLKSASNAVNAIEASNFRPIWEVLDALKAHDDVFAWDLDQIRTEMGRTPGTSVSADDLGKLGISLPSTVDESFGTALRTYLVEQVTVSWNFWFGLLEAYVKENGSAWVSAKHVTRDGYKLGMWVNGQRNAKLNGQLSEERISRLESLPGWVWDAYQEKWEIGFSELMEYVKAHGSATVPQAYVSPTGYKLGAWLSTGRRKKLAGQLSSNRISRLEAVPGWSWAVVLDERWETAFKALEEYVALVGTSWVSARYVTPSGFRLGRWTEGQRRLWLKQSLDQDRAQRLQRLPGWIWETKQIRPRIVLDWDDAFCRLVEYVSREGDAKVPRRYEMPDGFDLGFWVSVQRKSQESLSSHQRSKLEALPAWRWAVQDAREAFRQRGLRELQGFVSREGHAKVPVDYETEDGFRLGAWVQQQRSRIDRLPSEHRSQLEILPGWTWDVRLGIWEEGFNHLIGFVKREGHANVPEGFAAEDGYRLGSWVQVQRRLKDKIYREREGKPEARREALNAETQEIRQSDKTYQDRIELLESIPGWIWSLRQERWEIAFSELLEYSALYGHAAVPFTYISPQGFNLGSWVAATRRRKQRNQLDQVRIERLEELPGWSWDGGVSADARWEHAFRLLSEFVEREGHARVAKNFCTAGEFRLGAWVQSQRSDIDRLPRDRRTRLESLRGWTWDALSNRWENGFHHLVDFVESEGHTRVKQDFVAEDGYPLGSWVRNQQSWRDKMSQGRRAKLETLPGWTWVTDSLQWGDWINLLKEFAHQNGHTRVPQLFKTSGGFLLGRWVNSRRTRRDRLTPEQQTELESLPGWVWRVT